MKYRLYGFVLETDISSENRLVQVKDDVGADIHLRYGVTDSKEGELERIYQSYAVSADGTPIFFIERGGNYDFISFLDMVRYAVGDSEVFVELVSETYSHLVEIHFLGLVMAYWMERRGIPALHSAAVVVEGEALGFLATNKGGKTSLAASFVLAGHSLLSDDILAVHPTSNGISVAAGYPQMRVWPDQATHFMGSYETLPIVHPDYDKRRIPIGDDGFGSFEPASVPVRALMIPQRREADTGHEIAISKLSAGEAMKTLLANGFIPGIAERLSMQHRRIPVLSQLVLSAPMYEVSYPSGFETLPRVREAILELLSR
ncbi:MAG: hypothetical protein ACOCTG_03750 [Bacteroidota bacterium]